jgi:hypothetical protein
MDYVYLELGVVLGFIGGVLFAFVDRLFINLLEGKFYGKL